MLFALVVFAWGFSWFAIHLQLGGAPAVVSVFWRFAIAAALLWGALALSGRWRKAPLGRHLWFAALGASLFSCNFLFFFAAESYAPSGVVAVVFSVATVFNALNVWAFDGVRPTLRVLVGSALGIAGVAMLFGDEFSPAGASPNLALGVAYALGGAYCFSLGNLISRRAAGGGVDLPNAVARGMAWGAALLALAAALLGDGFWPAATPAYLGALVYLAAIASVVAFLAYLTLVAEIGADKAAYVTAISPIVALAVSAAWEGYVWSAFAGVGIVLIMAGNLTIFLRLGASRRAVSRRPT
jgi:drug/metabolite transporter (DMT)-like permease